MGAEGFEVFDIHDDVVGREKLDRGKPDFNFGRRSFGIEVIFISRFR